MMFCERARPAGIVEGWTGSSRKTKPYSRTKSNGMLVIRWPVGRIHIQNVLNKEISSCSAHYLG